MTSLRPPLLPSIRRISVKTGRKLNEHNRNHCVTWVFIDKHSIPTLCLKVLFAPPRILWLSQPHSQTDLRQEPRSCVVYWNIVPCVTHKPPQFRFSINHCVFRCTLMKCRRQWRLETTACRSNIRYIMFRYLHSTYLVHIFYYSHVEGTFTLTRVRSLRRRISTPEKRSYLVFFCIIYICVADYWVRLRSVWLCWISTGTQWRQPQPTLDGGRFICLTKRYVINECPKCGVRFGGRRTCRQSIKGYEY